MLRIGYQRVKLLCGVLAAGALIVMGALTFQLGHGAAENSASVSSLGKTTTSTAPGTTLATPVAKPTLKAQRPKGY